MPPRRRSAGTRAARRGRWRRNSAPSSKGTTWVIRCRRIASPSARSRASVSGASRRRSQAAASGRGTRLIWAQRIARPLWWNSSPSRGSVQARPGRRPDRSRCPAAAAPAAPGAGSPTWARVWNTNSAPRPQDPCQQALACRQASSSGNASKPRFAGDAAAPGRGLGDQHLGARRGGRRARSAARPCRRPRPPRAAPRSRRRARRPRRRRPRRRRGGCRWRRSAPSGRRRCRGSGRAPAAASAAGRARGSAVCPLLWPKVVATKSPVAKPGARAVDRPGRLPCSPRNGTGKRAEGSPGMKTPSRLVPAGVQVGVGRLEEGELGPGRKAGEAQVQPHLALGRRALAILGVGRPRPGARRRASGWCDAASGNAGILGSGGAKDRLRVGPQPLHPYRSARAGRAGDGEGHQMCLDRLGVGSRGCGSRRPAPRRRRRDPRARPGRPRRPASAGRGRRRP